MSWFAAPPTSPSHPIPSPASGGGLGWGLGPSLSPLKGGEGPLSAGTLIQESTGY
jgi:hypothetical protein